MVHNYNINNSFIFLLRHNYNNLNNKVTLIMIIVLTYITYTNIIILF